MTVDLLHPRTSADVVDITREASEHGRTLLIVGGRTHFDRGNPITPDAELWTTQLDEVITYEPAEMIVVVQAGIRCGALASLLAERGQEWPVDAPPDSTVGGVISAGVSSFRRLRVGHVRDTVVEMTVVTGDGRTIRSGARTVKNVSGYDMHRLLTGSLGTLGVIVEVALKVRPLPRSGRVLRAGNDGTLPLGERLAAAVPGVAAVVSTPNDVTVHLEGWPEEVEDQRTAATAVVGLDEVAEIGDVPGVPEGGDVVAEVAVAPSRLASVLEPRPRWKALAGVGLAWVEVDGPQELADLREDVATEGGIAPVIRGPGGLGEADLPALEVQRRIKKAFDPSGILAPGRFWGGM
jgi:glycolate oxidase FAD binding subunit